MKAIFCGNLEYDVRQSDLERLFRRYGKVDRVDMKSSFAFVYMEDDRDAEDAIRALDRFDLGRTGRRLRVEWTKQERSSSRRPESNRRSSSNLRPSKTLFVINFDPYLTRTRDLERHFEPYGKILNVRIRRNFAFVHFESQEEATKALDATNLSKLLDRVISVEYAVKGDDERHNGYAPDRSPQRGGYDRVRSPSPRRRERGSPDYGHGRGPSRKEGHVRGRSPSPRKERESDYHNKRNPSPRKERESDYHRKRSSSPRKERESDYQHKRVSSPRKERVTDHHHKRSSSPRKERMTDYHHKRSSSPRKERVSDYNHKRSSSPRKERVTDYHHKRSPSPRKERVTDYHHKRSSSPRKERETDNHRKISPGPKKEASNGGTDHEPNPGKVSPNYGQGPNLSPPKEHIEKVMSPDDYGRDTSPAYSDAESPPPERYVSQSPGAQERT